MFILIWNSEIIQIKDNICESNHTDCNLSDGNEWYSLWSEKRRGPRLDKIHYFVAGQKKMNLLRNLKRQSKAKRLPIYRGQKERDRENNLFYIDIKVLVNSLSLKRYTRS